MLKSIFQKQTLKEFLFAKGLFNEEQWAEIEGKTQSLLLTEMSVISRDYCSPEVYNALVEYTRVPKINLREIPKVAGDVLKELPRQMMTEHHVFVFDYGDSKSILKVALTDPLDTEVIERLEIRTSKTVEPYIAPWADIDNMLTKYFGSSDALEAADAYTKRLQSAVGGGSTQSTEVNEISPDSPIITVVNSLIEQAAKLRASDIHIEPFESFLRIRYRIDGALVERPSFPMSMHSAIIARLKVMSGMDISEKRIPQDGRITYEVDKVEYDIRASALPTVYGEKFVMRLALKANLKRDKRDLGLTEYDLKIFNKVFSNANGIILVTGPTGSGKSTTLYTALNELSTEEVNIVTVEDPVEANVDGVNQVQTNARAGMDFAAALRSILRQDPDIIMIGEMRDSETAEIAVQAAITGHLVVSTLHTNSSSASITRLVNMGLPPYLVADSVVGILAQRLVRRLCPHCKKERLATAEDIAELGLKPNVSIKIYDKCGCPYCNNTGYQGRIAVYEIMDVGPEIKAMIMANAPTADIKKVAIENGMHTLHRSAAELVVKGITTITEMRKVSSEG